MCTEKLSGPGWRQDVRSPIGTMQIPGLSAAVRLVPTPVGALAVRDHGGSKPPLMMWPSLFSDHHLYDLVVPLLRSSWRIVLFDGPGFGESAPPRPGTQPEAYADAIISVMDQLGIASAMFAGTSWGGQIGAHLALRAPRRVTGLLMMNVPLLPSQGGHWFEVGMARLLGNRPLYANGVARAMFSPKTQSARPEVVRHFTVRFSTFERRDAAVSAATTLRAFAGLASVLPRIEVPSSILMGADDPLYRPETLLPVAKTLPGVVIRVVPDCGHLAPLEAPDAVASAIFDLARGNLQ